MPTDAEWAAVLLSVRVAIIAVAVMLPFAIATGYYLSRSRSRLAWGVEVLVNLPLVLPPVVTGFALLMFLGRGGPAGRVLESLFGVQIVFTWLAAVIAAGVVGFPLMARAIRLGFDGVDPRMERAARTLGSGRWEAFARVSLPLAGRGVLAGAVLGFARALGEFGATLVVAGNIPGRTQTIPLAIYSHAQTPGGLAASWRLVTVSVALAAVALLAGEFLDRRGRSDGDARL